MPLLLRIKLCCTKLKHGMSSLSRNNKKETKVYVWNCCFYIMYMIFFFSFLFLFRLYFGMHTGMNSNPTHWLIAKNIASESGLWPTDQMAYSTLACYKKQHCMQEDVSEEMGTRWSQAEVSDHKPWPSEESSKTSGRDEQIEAKPCESTILANGGKKVEAQVITLPHNYEAILTDADSPIDKSSTGRLYDQLRAGVLLSQKTKKYWVDKKSNSNCFFLYARNLSITWAEDNRYWRWPCIQETSDAAVDVAELLDVCWLEVQGRFETAKLSPGAPYEVAFVIMLRDPAYGWEVPVNVRLTLPDGTKQEHKENLMKKPRGEWIEIPAGEFVTWPEKTGEIKFSIYENQGGEWKRGLIIKGVAIRPKNIGQRD